MTLRVKWLNHQPAITPRSTFRLRERSPWRSRRGPGRRACVGLADTEIGADGIAALIDSPPGSALAARFTIVIHGESAD
jgi:hypothetical protein